MSEDRAEQLYQNQEWNFPLVKEYMLALTRGKDFLLPHDQFPKRIELSDELQEQLALMRKLSRDGKERWALLGFKEDRRSLYTHIIPALGERTEISSELIDQEIQKAKAELGIVDLVSDIHSHPDGRWRLIHNFSNSVVNLSGGDLRGFSPMDLYALLTPDIFLPMMMLSETNLNMVAFRSKETRTVPSSKWGFTQKNFHDYWARQNKGKLANALASINPTITPWSISQKIAQSHKLVIYSGAPGQKLARITPNTRIAL